MLTHPEEQRQKADPTEPTARLGKGSWGGRACLGGQHAPQSQGFLSVYRGGLKGPILLEAVLRIKALLGAVFL